MQSILEIVKERTFVIAEIGINHNGDLELAKAMIRAAVECGADAVKFQTFRAEEFMSDRAVTYSYINNGKQVTESMYEMFKRLELPLDYYKILFDFACSLGVIPFTSVADSLSYDFINSIGLPILKLASEDLINVDLLQYVNTFANPVILSSGMANEYEIANAVNYFKDRNDIVLLHCVSLYPTPINQLNLLRLKTLYDKFNLVTGFSDHSKSLISGAVAVGNGAKVIEKHFTLDNNLSGPDQEVSLNREDFKVYINNIRQAELMLGNGTIEPEAEEKKAAINFRRGITLARDLNKGDIITREDLLFQRPCPYLKPYQQDLVTGRTLKYSLKAGTKISMDDIS